MCSSGCGTCVLVGVALVFWWVWFLCSRGCGCCALEGVAVVF